MKRGLLLLLAAACLNCGGRLSTSLLFSFEEGLEGWVPDGTDLDLGGSPVDWSIIESEERAFHGSMSAKLYLANYNDAGKIWLERVFDVEPSRRYRVDVTYRFATSDFGTVNLWTIICGVRPSSPETADDLTFQGTTSNGSAEDVGYLWLEKDFDFVATSGPEGELHVFIGVWGTWETPRTYYLDSVRVSIR